jgi:protein-tyrosine phosphatase
MEIQVAEFTFPGYPCPPMQYLLMICKSILEWLSNDKNNVAFIHCQSNKGRSAVVIACLLTLLKVVNHPMEALTYFCNV